MKAILQLLCFLCLPCLLFGQNIEREVISNAGNANKDANVSMTYTIGEAIIATSIQDTIVVQQGFEQGRFDTIVTSIELANEFLDLKVFPNPAIEYIMLELEKELEQKLTYQIITVEGKQIQTNSFATRRQRIDVKSLPAASYVLQLLSEKGKMLYSTTIIKLN